MSRDIWSPRQYRAYASHRARPFYELLARVDVEAPAYVVDLGCGPGERTVDLTVRWPGAVIEGIDSSVQMITEARLMTAKGTPHLRGSLPADDGPAATGDPAVREAEVSPNPAPAGSRGVAVSKPSGPPPDPSASGTWSASPDMSADGPAATGDPEVREAEVSRNPAPAASPGMTVSEPRGPSPDPSRTSAASPDVSAAQRAIRGGESGSSAYVAGSSGGEAL